MAALIIFSKKPQNVKIANCEFSECSVRVTLHALWPLTCHFYTQYDGGSCVGLKCGAEQLETKYKLFSFYQLCARYDTNKAAVGEVSELVRGLLRCCLLSKCHLASRYTCKCTFVYADTESKAYLASIFVITRNVQQHHMQISRTEFYPSRKERSKMPTEMRLPLSVECGFQCADFCGTPNRETKYSKYFII